MPNDRPRQAVAHSGSGIMEPYIQSQYLRLDMALKCFISCVTKVKSWHMQKAAVWEDIVTLRSYIET